VETLGSGAYRYNVVEGWEQLPAGWTHADVAGVATDAEDRVYLYTRSTPRVIVYNQDGSFVKSWGEGLFHDKPVGSSHGITIGPDGAVWCVDDGNHTVKKFTPDGDLLLTIGNEGVVYVAELWRRVGEVSQRLGRNEVDAPARISVLAPDGSVLSRWGGPNRCDPGMLCAPHSLALDSRGDLYVGEVTYTFGVSRGDTPADCHTFQKFARVR